MRDEYITIEDLPDEVLEQICLFCKAKDLVNVGSTCRILSTCTVRTAENLFYNEFGKPDDSTPPIPNYLLRPRSQLFRLVERARSSVEVHQQEIFSWAAAIGFSKYIQKKLSNTATAAQFIQYKNYEGATPLYLATKQGRHEVISILLRHGAEVNQAGTRRNPLLQACKMSRPDLIQPLLDGKADPILRHKINLGTTVNKDEGQINSPLQACIQQNITPVRLQCLEIVCNALTVESGDRDSLCARLAFLQACEIGELDYVMMMGKCQVGITHPAAMIWKFRGTTRFDGATPLLLASQSGREDVVEYLLQEKIAGDINAALPTGKTALFLSAERANTNLVKLLLQYSASLDVQTCTGRSALFAAVEHCHQETVEVICENCEVKHLVQKTKGEEGVTPFMLAERRGNPNLIIPMLEAYHREVRRRYMLRSYGDAIDDVSVPYLSKKVEQYRDFMFVEKKEKPSQKTPPTASQNRSATPNKSKNNRYRRVMDQRMIDGKTEHKIASQNIGNPNVATGTLRLSTVIGEPMSPRDPAAPPWYLARPVSASRVSQGGQNGKGEPRKQAANNLRNSMPAFGSNQPQREAKTEAPRFRHTQVSLLRQSHTGTIHPSPRTPSKRSKGDVPKIITAQNPQVPTIARTKNKAKSLINMGAVPQNILPHTITVNNGEDMYDSD